MISKQISPFLKGVRAKFVSTKKKKGRKKTKNK